MTATAASPQPAARAAGALYLVIIVAGLWSELGVRARLVAPDDAATTAENILGSETLFRASTAADALMALCDVGLAVLLFALLRPVSLTLALMATAFRLVQTAVIAASLVLQHGALLALTNTAGAIAQPEALALLLLELHAFGYDLGLAFFGVCSLLLGALIWRSGYLPRALGALVAAAGAVYLAGTALRFLAPALLGAFQPAYAVCLLAETALCLWLLIRGVDAARWLERTLSSSPP